MKQLRFIPIFLLIGLSLSTYTSCVHEPVLPIISPQDTTSNPPDTTINPPDTTTVPNDTTNAIKPCDPDSVYFERDILPVLISNCTKSNCHDEITKADGFALTSYENVMSSNEIDPFDLDGSDFYEVLLETDPDKVMPPPPTNPLPQESIDLIGKWIVQGAQNIICSDDTSSACNTTEILYSTTVSEILETHCTGCHSGADSRGGVKLDTYAEVKKSADNGELYGSIAHLSGFSKMPRNGSKLPDCDIAQIKAWIDAGAENN